MFRVKALVLASCLGFVALGVSNADEWNKKTILTINEPVQIPGKVLQPGKYVMKLLESQSNRHIVQIFNADETQIQTTILAIPNYRLQPTGKTSFGWWETPAGQPRALRSWFYPGDNFGQEFAYPKGEAVAIAQTSSASVPVTYAESEAQLGSAKVASVDRSGAEQALDKKTYAAPAATTAKAAEPAPAQTLAQNEPQPMPQATAQPSASQTEPVASKRMARTTLPRTASQFPLFGLAGLLSLGVASALRAARRS